MGTSSSQASNTRPTCFKLLAEQVAGYYDEKSKTKSQEFTLNYDSEKLDLTFGAMYFLFPRLWGRPGLYSTRLVAVHYWIATIGIARFVKLDPR